MAAAACINVEPLRIESVEAEDIDDLTSEAAATTIQALPPDLLLQVLSRLPLHERCSSSQLVCSRWASACASPELWRAIDLSLQAPWRDRVGRPLLQGLVFLSQQAPRGGGGGGGGLRMWPGPCPIRELRLSGCSGQFSVMDLAQIIKQCPELRVLDISGVSSRHSGQPLLSYLPDLMYLQELVTSNPRCRVEELYVDAATSGLWHMPAQELARVRDFADAQRRCCGRRHPSSPSPAAPAQPAGGGASGGGGGGGGGAGGAASGGGGGAGEGGGGAGPVVRPRRWVVPQPFVPADAWGAAGPRLAAPSAQWDYLEGILEMVGACDWLRALEVRPGNGISDNGLCLIMQHIQPLRQLTSLSICDNYVTCEGVLQLADAMHGVGHSSDGDRGGLSHLKHLSLAGNEIGETGATALALALSMPRCALRMLDLSRNPAIGTAGSRTLLFGAQRAADRLDWLDLSGCMEDPDGLAEVWNLRSALVMDGRVRLGGIAKADGGAAAAAAEGDAAAA